MPDTSPWNSPTTNSTDTEHRAPPLHILGHSGTFDSSYYIRNNPDLRHLGTGVLKHYHQHGWREGRKPNPFFDPHWYLEQNRGVIGDPLLHYVLYGEREGRRPIAWFDPTWYGQNYTIPEGMLALTHYLLNRDRNDIRPIEEFDPAFYLKAYPDVAASGLDPLEHYMIQGFREVRKPFEGFDPVYYRAHYLRHAPDSNPLLHYLSNKHRSGVYPSNPGSLISPFREARRRSAPGPFFEARSPIPPMAIRRARVLAYYLPQYHATEENNDWWGDGFTEWTNIARGMPRFADHYQPRIPRDLGHYTLDHPEILKRQAVMAREAGIEGFIFYFYWFNGRRLLDRPLEMLLAHPEINLPFCLMWANENWSRRWDGSEDEILIAQNYRTQDDAALVDCFARHMRDTRYIHVGTQPLLMIYRPGAIPDCPRAVARWRSLFRQRHGLNPIFVMGQAFGDEDPAVFGLDGAIEFPPHKIVSGCRLINDEMQMLDHDSSAQIYDYAEIVDRALKLPAADFPLIRTAAPSWDNDARRQGQGLVLHGSTPALYERWLSGLIDHARRYPFHGDPIVCINAWNEWAEGAYLEPDQHFGSAYLNATSRASTGFEQSGRSSRILLIGHDAFPAGAQRLLMEIGYALRSNHGADIRFILLEGGELHTEYQKIAPTEILPMHSRTLNERLQELRCEGFNSALINSAAASGIAGALDKAAISHSLLIHELENLVRTRDLHAPLQKACTTARTVIVPQALIAERLGITTLANLTILPQGLYSRPCFSLKTRNSLRASLSIAADEKLIMGCGYGDLRKGFDLFIQMWQLSRSMKSRFIWVGQIAQELQDGLQAEIQEALASGTLQLTGQVRNIGPYLCAADVFVLTSREDPYPSVILEALATGLPCCAFENSGGIPPLLTTIMQEKKQKHAVVPQGNVMALVRAAHACAEVTLKEFIAVRKKRALENRPGFSFDAYTQSLLKRVLPTLPTISVVVLSYNYGHYLEGRLSSIFAQTLPVFEIILLDDGSEDDSVAIAQQVAAQWKRTVRVVRNRKPSGSVFHQWKKAAEVARGEWLWIAEADDLSEADFLESMTASIQRHPEAVMAFADSRAIDAHGITVMPSYRPYCAQSAGNLLDHDSYYTGPEFIRHCLTERNLILNVSSAIFRKSSFLTAMNACRDELSSLRIAGDWRLYLELLNQPDVGLCYSARPLNIHRRHAQSATHSLAREQHLEEIRNVQDTIYSRTGRSKHIRNKQDRYLQSLKES